MLQLDKLGVPGEQSLAGRVAGVQPIPCTRGLPPAVGGPGVFAWAPVTAAQKVVFGDHRAGHAGNGDEGAKPFPGAFSPRGERAQSMVPAQAVQAALSVTVADTAWGHPSLIVVWPFVPPPVVNLSSCTIRSPLWPSPSS